MNMRLDWTPLPVEPSVLGESPLWHPTTQVLYWCDIPSAVLHAYDPASGRHRRWDMDSHVACCVPVADGTLVLALRSGIVHFDPADGATVRLADAPYDPATERFNDGKCDPAGRFWVGTIYEPRTPALGALYCAQWGRQGLTLERREQGITVSNGLAFSPDGRTIYRSDTPTHAIVSAPYRVDTGETGEWTVFARQRLREADRPLSEYRGRPDGAAVDAQGHYWSAMYEGQCVVRHAPDGQVLDVVELPVRCATMPCFGGADLRTLYLTTARQGRPEEELREQPWAGCVLSARVEVPGLPAHCIARP